MQRSTQARAMAIAAVVAAFAPAAFARSLSFEQWSIDWLPGFADDFEDGVFTSGPGEPYTIACGTANEVGGKLAIGTATLPCAGFEVRPLALVPGGLVIRALFSLPTTAPPTLAAPNPNRIAPTYQARFGIAVRNPSGTDEVFLHVRRSNDQLQCASSPCEAEPAFGTGGNDVIYVELAGEDGTVSRTVALTQVLGNPNAPDLPNAYELELTLTPSGTQLLPSGRYRECKVSYVKGGPCSAAVPLRDLDLVADGVGVSADGGALAAGVAHTPSLYGTAPNGPYVVRLDDWDFSMSAADDFETPPLGTALPYQTSTAVCGGADVANGALGLDTSGGCPKVIAAAAGSMISETTATATLRYQLPAVCAQQGVAFNAGTDQANLALVRDADGSLALWLTTEPESGSGPALPVLARTLLSTTPASDAVLRLTKAIELRLSVARPPGGSDLLPSGEYRLCPTSPCSPELPFLPLGLASFETPPDLGCGADFADRALPSDAGVLAGDAPVAASLFATPEPDAFAAALAGIAALLVCRDRRR